MVINTEAATDSDLSNVNTPNSRQVGRNQSPQHPTQKKNLPIQKLLKTEIQIFVTSLVVIYCVVILKGGNASLAKMLYHVIFFFLWRCDPTPVMASSFLMFLDHTQQRTTVGKSPLDEWSARRRDLYLTTHNTHNKHPCPWWDSNPRSQLASGRRPTSYTARPLGPAFSYNTVFKYIYIYIYFFF